MFVLFPKQRKLMGFLPRTKRIAQRGAGVPDSCKFKSFCAPRCVPPCVPLGRWRGRRGPRPLCSCVPCVPPVFLLCSPCVPPVFPPVFPWVGGGVAGVRDLCAPVFPLCSPCVPPCVPPVFLLCSPCVQVAPKWFQESPKSHLGIRFLSRGVENEPKIIPSRPPEAPRWLQDGSKRAPKRTSG